jgi:hypothetical protein
MEKRAERLIRQQYLVPRRSVVKLKELSKAERVSATEIVRRAIDAYDPAAVPVPPQDEAAAVDLMEGLHGQLRALLERIDAELADLTKRHESLAGGKLRRKVRRETEEWAKRNPAALAGLAELFAGRAEEQPA